MENNEFSIKIGNFVQTKILKYEYLVILFVILALALRLLKVTNSRLIITLVLSSIACIYFFSAFAINEEIEYSGFELFIKKLVGLASSVSLIGILFKIQKWPNSDIMLTVGLITSICGLTFIVIQKNKISETEKFSMTLVIRILILIFISAGLLYFGIK